MVLAGAIVGIAIPLAAMLATSGVILDIVVWGIVAVILQLLTVAGCHWCFVTCAARSKAAMSRPA